MLIQRESRDITLQNPLLLETVQFQEPNVDKIYYMLSRQFRSILYDLSVANPLKIELHSVIDYERIIKRLEGIADHCNNLANIALRVLQEDTKSMRKISDVLFNNAELVKQHLRDAMRAFYMGTSWLLAS